MSNPAANVLPPGPQCSTAHQGGTHRPADDPIRCAAANVREVLHAHRLKGTAALAALVIAMVDEIDDHYGPILDRHHRRLPDMLADLAIRPPSS